jgi:hypothetical protein
MNMRGEYGFRLKVKEELSGPGENFKYTNVGMWRR